MFLANTDATVSTNTSDTKSANPTGTLPATTNIGDKQSQTVIPPATQGQIGMPSTPPKPPNDANGGAANNLNARNGPEWWVMAPWIVPFITLYGGYWLGRRNTALTNVVTLTLQDMTAFRDKIDEFIPLVKAHQRGTPSGTTTTLETSRQHLTELRKSAVSIHRQIQGALKNETHKQEWKNAYGDWKESTEGETGLIINKKQKWSDDGILRIEEASSKYALTISRFRHRIAAHKIPIG